jgi:hypothetical protein
MYDIHVCLRVDRLLKHVFIFFNQFKQMLVFVYKSQHC